MRQGIKQLGYAHVKSSAVDHIVRDVAFGGAVSMWCDWEGGLGVFYTTEPRIKGRVCRDCEDAKKAAIYAHTQEQLNQRPPAKKPDGSDL